MLFKPYHRIYGLPTIKKDTNVNSIRRLYPHVQRMVRIISMGKRQLFQILMHPFDFAHPIALLTSGYSQADH